MSFFGFLRSKQLSRQLKCTNMGSGLDFYWVSKDQSVCGIAYGDGRRVVPFVFSGDGRWYPQRVATVEVFEMGIKAWKTQCQFGDDNTKHGAPFKLVIVETNESISGYPVFDLPSGLKSATYLVRRISRLI